MKTKIIELYEYSELSKEAQEKALNKWDETNDDPMMQSHMINLLKEKLDDLKIKYNVDSIDVRYSLSFSQGDGFMFIGKIMWREKDIRKKILELVEITITHNNSRYYHMRTANFDYDGLSDAEFKQFEAVYEAICREMERIGYAEIEYQQSEVHFEEVCDSMGYTFRVNGVMENA